VVRLRIPLRASRAPLPMVFPGADGGVVLGRFSRARLLDDGPFGTTSVPGEKRTTKPRMAPRLGRSSLPP